MPEFLALTEQALALIFERCGQQLVAAAPLGLGKPNVLLNAIYRAVAGKPGKSLKLFTALSLARPSPKPGLEARFLGPFLARQFGADYPDLAYVSDRRAGRLPANVQIHEFYFQSGASLGNADAQRQYASINYTHVARDMAAREPNLIVQLVARRGDRLSLSCNPDVTMDLLDRLRAAGKPRPLVVAVVHPDLPFLGRDAEVPLDFADAIVEDAQASRCLFALPREPVLLAEHALGLNAATLVRDGGTLQIGIGALSDALVHALILRQQHNADYVGMIDALGLSGGDSQPLQKGLYGASEMVMDGFMHLRTAGILKRQVYDDLGLQELLNSGAIGEVGSAVMLDRLLESAVLPAILDQPALSWLKRFGLIEPKVKLHDGVLYWPDSSKSGADLLNQDARHQLAQRITGQKLTGGCYLHGAFWLGSKQLQDWLRTLNPEDYAGLCMTRVSNVNQLYGGREALDTAQRHEARFFNTCMLQTVLGAAVSDGIADNQVVSGVGGQYNFVAMAHAIPNGRSILMQRATRESAGALASNIVWSYPHVTIPRHLRDIVVTEYGIADLRGATDEECVQRMLSVCDARFIDALANEAKRHGKLAPDWQVPPSYRENLPETLALKLKPWAQARLPTWPFGCDFDAQELALIGALKRLKAATLTPTGRIATLAKALLSKSEPHHALLKRMGLDQPSVLGDRVLAKLLRWALG